MFGKTLVEGLQTPHMKSYLPESGSTLAGFVGTTDGSESCHRNGGFAFVPGDIFVILNPKP